MPVIDAGARACFPGVDFVNAYGLTETSSSIAVLTPEDHRQALASDDAAVRRRLGSVGRPLPTVEITVREPRRRGVAGRASRARSGCVASRSPASTTERRTAGPVQRLVRHQRRGAGSTTGGYLYVEGRIDDVIVRGGENLSPGEIEDVLLEHPAVRECAVVGIPDEEWGEVVAAVVVPHDGHVVDEQELSDFVVVALAFVPATGRHRRSAARCRWAIPARC